MSGNANPAPSLTPNLESPPLAGQTISHNGKEFTTIKEGLAYILVPTEAAIAAQQKRKSESNETQAVFYNPIQQFNRDLTVLAIRAFGEDVLSIRREQAERRKALNTKKPESTTKRKRSEAEGTTCENEDEKPKRLRTEASTTEIIVNNGTLSTRDPNDSVSDPPCSTTLKVVDEDKHADWPGNEAGGTRTSSYLPRFTILDALSATGLRALRYAQEIPFASMVTANDMSKGATDSIKMNVAHNKLDGKIRTITGNALAHMYGFIGNSKEPGGTHKGKYDVVDLDPYGTAVPFLDAAMQAINDGGMLCVTCTDAGVFASVGYPEKTFALYGGTPMKGHHSHEGGLRLVLHAIATSAARYGMSIEPLLSLSIDFYVRLFVRIRKSPAEVKLLAGKTMVVYNCDSGCGAWKTQLLGRNTQLLDKGGQRIYKHTLAQGPSGSPHCEHCGFKTHLGGPMFAGPLHNPHFIETILGFLPDIDPKVYSTHERIEGMLSTALEETLIDGASDGKQPLQESAVNKSRLVPPMDPSLVERHPFFFNPSTLAKVLHAQAPSAAAVRGAIRYSGYRVTRSHIKPNSVRTDAPWEFIWTMMREWVRQKAPIKEGAVRLGTAGWGILHGGDFRKEDNHDAPATSYDHSRSSEAPLISEQTSDPQATPIIDDKSNATHQWTIVFDEALGTEATRKRLVRYPANPRENWGPMNRAKG